MKLLFTNPNKWAAARTSYVDSKNMVYAPWNSAIPLHTMRSTHEFGWGYVRIEDKIKRGDFVLWNLGEEWKEVEITNIYPPGEYVQISSSPIKRKLPWWQPQA